MSCRVFTRPSAGSMLAPQPSSERAIPTPSNTIRPRYFENLSLILLNAAAGLLNTLERRRTLSSPSLFFPEGVAGAADDCGPCEAGDRIVAAASLRFATGLPYGLSPVPAVALRSVLDLVVSSCSCSSWIDGGGDCSRRLRYVS